MNLSANPPKKVVHRSVFVDAVGCAYEMGRLNPVEDNYSGFCFMGWEVAPFEVKNALREYITAQRSK